MDLTERTIESKTMFQGRIITVLLDTAGLPDGGTAQREVVLHPGGVAILALDEADNVALVRQYRYPLHGLLLELPAGKLDPGEDHRPAALRELSEETGLEAGELTYLATEKDPSTGSYMAKVTFNNAKSLFVPGEFYHVRIATPKEVSQITVPKTAVRTKDSGDFV